jgi:glycosyltransferase involved in cell wall biosynthesis
MVNRIGFISTRFAGTDGVSLEAAKWAQVLEQEGYVCYWFAGELDRNISSSFYAPEAHFKHGEVEYISNHIFGRRRRDPVVTELIHALRASLKNQLIEFIRQYGIQLLIVENAMTIPMNLPLGLALAEILSETQIPTIAHHHDFYWERKRFSVNAIGEYLPMAFPADLPNVRHVTINSPAQRALAHRRGIASTLIPNVLDFDQPPVCDEGDVRRLRQSIGLAPDDLMILQPTRLIKRKGIEHAIELVKSLALPNCKLVISHEDGDEGQGYSDWLQNMAREKGVDLRLIDQNIVSPWKNDGASGGQFSLWSVYAAADLVTFCSLYEGFGNGLLEAIYFKKPIVLNRYDIFISDIEPFGFEFLTIDGYLTADVISDARDILQGSFRTYASANKNYAIARHHFSYNVLGTRLRSILDSFSDMDQGNHRADIPEHRNAFIEEIPVQIAI